MSKFLSKARSPRDPLDVPRLPVVGRRFSSGGTAFQGLSGHFGPSFPSSTAEGRY